jgi:uncharacterized protein YdhG (YjbR/CyaY superfamily)
MKKEIENYIAKVEDPDNRAKFGALLSWVATEFPELEEDFKWGQPVFTAHGTFILGFKLAKAHLSLLVEEAAVAKFATEIATLKLKTGKGLVQVKWGQEMPFELLADMVRFNLEDKKEQTDFWRKK